MHTVHTHKPDERAGYSAPDTRGEGLAAEPRSRRTHSHDDHWRVMPVVTGVYHSPETVSDHL